MAQYINKEVLLAEIEKRKLPFKRDIEDGYYPTCLYALMDFEDFLNTLEVQEVDLEKEYKMFVDCDEGRSMFEVAMHFFELGLKAAQKGEQS